MKEKDNNEKSEKRAARSIGGGKKSLFIKIGIIAGAAVLVLIIVYICLYRAGFRPYIKVVSAAGDSIKFSGMVNAEGTPIKGKLFFADGSSATVNSETGEIEYSDGSVYIGELRDLQKNGKGKLTYASGDVYEGEYKDDVRSGTGTFTWANGEKYVGEFANNQMNGSGTYTWPSGRTFQGYFENGAIVEIDTSTNSSSSGDASAETTAAE